MKLIADIHASENGINLNGHVLKGTADSNQNTKFVDRLRSWYALASVKYPKFHKMDPFCKLGFLTCEFLMSSVQHNIPGERIGIFLLNSMSSIHTDVRFYNSYATSADKIASPALFVYTLPNILIGEIAIRHKITGEHMFFVQQNFAVDFIYLYVKTLFKNQQLDAAIIGACEFTAIDHRAQMGWIERDETQEHGVAFDLVKFRNWINPLP